MKWQLHGSLHGTVPHPYPVYSAIVYMFVKSNVSGGAVDADGGLDETTNSADDLVPSNVQNKRRDILTFRRTPRPVRCFIQAFQRHCFFLPATYFLFVLFSSFVFHLCFFLSITRHHICFQFDGKLTRMTFNCSTIHQPLNWSTSR